MGIDLSPAVSRTVMSTLFLAELRQVSAMRAGLGLAWLGLLARRAPYPLGKSNWRECTRVAVSAEVTIAAAAAAYRPAGVFAKVGGCNVLKSEC